MKSLQKNNKNVREKVDFFFISAVKLQKVNESSHRKEKGPKLLFSLKELKCWKKHDCKYWSVKEAAFETWRQTNDCRDEKGEK